jgi:hypothetical protein
MPIFVVRQHYTFIVYQFLSTVISYYRIPVHAQGYIFVYGKPDYVQENILCYDMPVYASG